MRLAALVILYYPDNSLTDNIRSYINSVDLLILWDNTPQKDKNRRIIEEAGHQDKIVIMGMGYNTGLGKPINEAVKYLSEKGYTHLLSLDQDSYFKEGELDRYIEKIKLHGENRKEIFSTNYYIISQNKPYYPISPSIDTVAAGMNSGTIFPLAIFQETGPFNEDLIVWGIDCEFCWRAGRLGINTVCFKDILLQHNLGEQNKKHILFGKEVFPNEYSPDRSYYNVRNGIILHRTYPEHINLKAHLKYHFFKRFVFIILYEKNKFAKLRAITQGLLDGFMNVKGPRNK